MKVPLDISTVKIFEKDTILKAKFKRSLFIGGLILLGICLLIFSGYRIYKKSKNKKTDLNLTTTSLIALIFQPSLDVIIFIIVAIIVVILGGCFYFAQRNTDSTGPFGLWRLFRGSDRKIPGQKPVENRLEPVGHRLEPVGHRLEPVGHRLEPVGHRLEPVEADKGLIEDHLSANFRLEINSQIESYYMKSDLELRKHKIDIKYVLQLYSQREDPKNVSQFCSSLGVYVDIVQKNLMIAKYKTFELRDKIKYTERERKDYDLKDNKIVVELYVELYKFRINEFLKYFTDIVEAREKEYEILQKFKKEKEDPLQKFKKEKENPYADISDCSARYTAEQIKVDLKAWSDFYSKHPKEEEQSKFKEIVQSTKETIEDFKKAHTAKQNLVKRVIADNGFVFRKDLQAYGPTQEKLKDIGLTSRDFNQLKSIEIILRALIYTLNVALNLEYLENDESYSQKFTIYSDDFGLAGISTKKEIRLIQYNISPSRSDSLYANTNKGVHLNRVIKAMNKLCLQKSPNTGYNVYLNEIHQNIEHIQEMFITFYADLPSLHPTVLLNADFFGTSPIGESIKDHNAEPNFSITDQKPSYLFKKQYDWFDYILKSAYEVKPKVIPDVLVKNKYQDDILSFLISALNILRQSIAVEKGGCTTIIESRVDEQAEQSLRLTRSSQHSSVNLDFEQDKVLREEIIRPLVMNTLRHLKLEIYYRTMKHMESKKVELKNKQENAFFLEESWKKHKILVLQNLLGVPAVPILLDWGEEYVAYDTPQIRVVYDEILRIQEITNAQNQCIINLENNIKDLKTKHHNCTRGDPNPLEQINLLSLERMMKESSKEIIEEAGLSLKKLEKNCAKNERYYTISRFIEDYQNYYENILKDQRFIFNELKISYTSSK